LERKETKTWKGRGQTRLTVKKGVWRCCFEWNWSKHQVHWEKTKAGLLVAQGKFYFFQVSKNYPSKGSCLSYFYSFLNNYALPCTIAWNPNLCDVVFRRFWDSAQKPPGGPSLIARRRIFSAQFSGFYYESPDSKGEPARWRMVIVSVLYILWIFVILWLSSWITKFV